MTESPDAVPLAFSRVTRRFGPVTALAEVSLEVREGESLLLLGHNGAGKSTLLRIAAGLVRPTSGILRIAGAAAERGPSPAARRRLGYLGHKSFLFDHLTARENLELYAALYGAGYDRAALAEAWLERVGLSRAAHRTIRGFSRGMMQRLALARALIHEPEVLLLDEPASGLDPEGRRRLVEIVREERARGVTLLIVTHHADLGLSLADRVVVLRRGRVSQDDAADARDAEGWAAATAGRA